MGRVKETSDAFKYNFHGVIDHNGSVKVAQTSIRAEILHIHKNKNNETINVLVKGRKKSYVCQIHKNLKKDMIFVEKGDCAWIKWRNGTAWIVGFQKQKAYKQEIDISNTENLNKFMSGVDAE